jgi:hypothetical protein
MTFYTHHSKPIPIPPQTHRFVLKAAESTQRTISLPLPPMKPPSLTTNSPSLRYVPFPRAPHAPVVPLFIYIFFKFRLFGTLFFYEGGEIFLVKDEEEVREGGSVKERCFFFILMKERFIYLFLIKERWFWR